MGRLSWPKDARQLSIMLTIVAAISYSYSLSQARFEIGYFGSIHSLPISFFVALFLLTIASAILWVSSQPHGKLLSLQLSLLVIALHLTMLAIGGIGAAQSGASALFSFQGLSEYVFRIGSFGPPPPDLWPLNWPAAYILNTAVMLVLCIDDANIMLTLNIFEWIPLITLLVYVFLRNIIGKDNVNHCMAGTWLFFVANWILYYLTASVLGYMLFLVVMILLAQSLLPERKGISFAYRLCLILVLLILPATHLLSVLVALGMLLALYTIRRAKVSGLAMFLVIIIAAIIIASWSIYVTMSFLEGRLSLFLEQLKSAFRLDILWHLGVTERMVGSEAHQVVNNLRVLFATLFCAIGFAGVITALKFKNITNSEKFILTTVIGILAMLFIISVAYTYELLQRAYFFVLPAIACFGVKLLKHKITAIVLTILLLVTLPLHFISLYGNALTDYVSPAEISGAYFFHDHTSRGEITGAFLNFPLGFIENREKYHWVFLDELQWEGNTLKITTGYPHYLYLRRDDQAIYDFLGHNQEYHVDDNTKIILSEIKQRIDSATNYNLIYSAPTLSIYLAEAP